MSQRVLIVDDEKNVLDGIERVLRKQVDMQTATSGEEGLRVMAEKGPFALVISDMRMPHMNGTQFLARARDQAPDTVRIILSGYADLSSTIAAINEGHIYRFLSKPCAPEQLLAAVADGLEQHRLLISEKSLLQETLTGAIKMLIEVLGMIVPAASSRASRLQRYSIDLATTLGLSARWEWGLAAYVSQIGCVTLPADLLSRVEAAQPLSEEETRLYESHPEIAGRLLVSIPRLDDVAAIVTAQFGPLDLSGNPELIRDWDVRSAGRLLLRTAFEFDRLVSRGVKVGLAVQTLAASKLGLPPTVLKALSSMTVFHQATIVRQVRIKDLSLGMILDEDLTSPRGIRLVPAGQEITRTLIVKLLSIAGGVGVAEPFRVRVLV